ncbi:MAG: ras guanine nucleotide exchange factor domain-containing protein [Benjaminiella poitrasii]|nr:MAG: ras guanine nucleotide exchange factor domain-containing protein [Benjaminiella poitrasii]
MSKKSTSKKWSNLITPLDESRNTVYDGSSLERAALATVFGVKEYTESKIFWNAEEEEKEDCDVTVPPSGSKQVLQNSSSIQNTIQKALPLIPVVSGFDNFFSAEPVYKTKSRSQEQQLASSDLSDYPVDIFDWIESDENTNIILWSSDCNNEYYSQNTIATTTQQQTVDQKNIESDFRSSTLSKKKERWLTQLFVPGSLKLRLQLNLPLIFPSSSLRFPVQNAQEHSRIIEAATIEKIIEKLTVTLDYTFMTDFFLIYRVFMKPRQLCKFLVLRFKWSLVNNEEKRCVVRIRTFVVIRHWLLNYFLHDFIPDKELRTVLANFLNEMLYHPIIKQSRREQRIIKSLRRVVRRLKNIYYPSSSKVHVVDAVPNFKEDGKKQISLPKKPTHQKATKIIHSIDINTYHNSNSTLQKKEKRYTYPIIITNHSSIDEAQCIANDSNKHEDDHSTCSSSRSLIFENQLSINDSKISYGLKNNMNQMKEEANFISKSKTKNEIYCNKPLELGNNDPLDDNCSLDSIISPGDSYIEKENEQSSMLSNSFRISKIILTNEQHTFSQPINIEASSHLLPSTINIEASEEVDEIKTELLTAKLEQLNYNLQGEEKQIVADNDITNCLNNYRSKKKTINTTPPGISSILSENENEYPPRLFYNAQLAISSGISTPDLNHPINGGTHYFEDPRHILSRYNTSNDRFISTATFNHMTYYPSLVDSQLVPLKNDVIVDPSEQNLNQTTPKNMNIDSYKNYYPSKAIGYKQHQPLPLVDNDLNNKRQSKTLTYKHDFVIDPKTKPLSVLLSDQSQYVAGRADKNYEQPSVNIKKLFASPAFISYAKAKQLPRKPSDKSWRFSLPYQKTKELAPTTPKSRILEIDIHPPFLEKTLTTFNDELSIVLKYSTSSLAQQFCLIEKKILLDISWEELMDCRWTKMSLASSYSTLLNQADGYLNSLNPSTITGVSDSDHLPQGIYSRTKRLKQQNEKENESTERGVEKAINRFNAVCQWVSSEIVQTCQLNQRECKLYCNYATLIQILLGLQSPSVSRLKNTWALVNKHEMKILKELSSFTSPIKNWKNIRDSMTQVAEGYGESNHGIHQAHDNNIGSSFITQKKKKLSNNHSSNDTLPLGGCIPFLGIYLSDLVFNEELPSYLPSTYTTEGNKCQQKLHTNDIDMINTIFSQPLIHFRKYRIAATIIKRILVFQNLAKGYFFEELDDTSLYSACFQVPSLDRDAIQKMSYVIEPPETAP